MQLIAWVAAACLVVTVAYGPLPLIIAAAWSAVALLLCLLLGRAIRHGDHTPTPPRREE